MKIVTLCDSMAAAFNELYFQPGVLNSAEILNLISAL